MQHPVEVRSRQMCWLVVAGAVASLVAACVKTPGGSGRETTRARARPGTAAGTSAQDAQAQAAANAALLLASMGWTCPDGAFAGSFTSPGMPECAALRVVEEDDDGGLHGDGDGDDGDGDDDDGDGDDGDDGDGDDGDDDDDDGDDGGGGYDDGYDDGEAAARASVPTHEAFVDIQGTGGTVSMPLGMWTVSAQRTTALALAGVLPLRDVGAHGLVVVHTDTTETETRDEVVVYVVQEGQLQPIGSVYGPVVLVDRIDMEGVHARVVEGTVVDGKPARGARVRPVVMRYADGAIRVDAEDR